MGLTRYERKEKRQGAAGGRNEKENEELPPVEFLVLLGCFGIPKQPSS